MTKYLILCVDDEREVLDSVLQDLAPFEEHFIVEGAESVTEAKQVIEEMADEEVQLALILCDHIMPEQTGISRLDGAGGRGRPRGTTPRRRPCRIRVGRRERASRRVPVRSRPGPSPTARPTPWSSRFRS